MNNQFYKFSSKHYLNTIHVWPKIAIDFAGSDKDRPYWLKNIDMTLWFGEYPPSLEFPVEFIVQGGTKLRDLIDTRTVTLLLISDHVRRVFEDNGVTGWKPYDVIVRRKSGELIPGFNGISIVGRLPENWYSDDAELPDIFHVPPAWTICTPRLLKILKKNKINCFDLRPIDKKRCEKILNIRDNFGSADFQYERSDFFDRIYESLH